MTKPFKDQLLEFRKKAKMTQVDLAKLLGCASTRISEWERGVRTPKPLTQMGIFLTLKKQKKGLK